MTEHRFHQSHECEGYRAKITIEWCVPEDVEFAMLPPWRKAVAEEIAESIIGFAGPKMQAMVNAMRGYKPTPPKGSAGS